MKNRGYTLIELSIVIVIISILTGGVFVFRSWQRSSQLKAIITEFYNYREAVTQFQETYGQLPGDLTTASSFWPTCASPATLCNGNGDGLITVGGGTTQDESIRAWQMLYLAGFISQSMSGVHTTSGQNDIGVNVPASKLVGAGWYFDKNLPSTGGGGVTTNFIVIGGFTSGYVNVGRVLTPIQALSIDTKIDDGRAISGVVRGLYVDSASYNYGSAGTQCSLSATNTYNILTNGNSLICALAFMLDSNQR